MTIMKWPAFITASAVVVALLMPYGCAGSGEKAEGMGDIISRQVRLMQAAAVNTISEPERREKMLVLIDQFEDTIQQHLRDFEAYAAKFQSLYHDYDTSNAILADELVAFVALRQTQRDRIMELHFKMVALTSAEEWEKIIDHELEAIETGTIVPATGKEG